MKETIYQNTNRNNLLQIIWLRLIAIFGQVVTILFVCYFLHITLPLKAMFFILSLLIIVNFASFYRYKFQKNISNKSLFIELLFDVATLTAQLYFSGGISNPFISLFLLQVIIGAILLQKTYAWIIVVITIFCYVWLSFNYQELHSFQHHQQGDFFDLHLHGMLVSYVVASILLLIFISKIIKNLKERDEKINLMKQQFLEKEQVINMGLLATGTAHELGTPLSIISVIIGDWKKINLTKDLLKDINLIEEQVMNCKKILSKILSSSGKERLEQATMKNIREFFDEMIKNWAKLRKIKNLNYHFEGKSDKKILLNDVLIQAFFNIFDNALAASPNFIAIDILLTENNLVASIKDKGKGFDNKIIKQIGKPNITTKNSSGLGLFLTINTLSRFGGDLKINNLSIGGAEVLITIPLKNL